MNLAKLPFLLALLLSAPAWALTATQMVALNAQPHRVVCPPAGFQNGLVIHQISVGQGDAALIRTPSGHWLLIDGGEAGNGRSAILPTLQQCYTGANALKKLDYIVVTHPHSDHFGGISDFIRNADFPIGEVIFPSDRVEAGDDGSQFNDLLALVDSLKAKGTRKVLPSDLGDKEIADKDVDFDIIVSDGRVLSQGPVAGVHDANGANVDNNSVSIGMIVTFHDFKFFTAGDLTGGKTATGENHPNVESEVAKSAARVDVYKASHHGSDTSNKTDLLNVLRPVNVLVSVGAGGKNLSAFHLPRAQAIGNLNALPSVQNIFLTSQGQSADILPVGKFKKFPKVHDLGGLLGSDLIVTTDAQGATYTISGYKFVSTPFKTTAK